MGPCRSTLSICNHNAIRGHVGRILRLLPSKVDGANEIEIGYRLRSEYWNKGIATEAARAVRDHAFRDSKLDRVVSLIHPENVASRRVAEKIGMTPDRETIFRGFPTIVFAISREIWWAKSGV